ncbi:MAG: NUDIX domain-containing protein [Oscillospiraceae bacterium]|nr:NUDIX domain-containing protein [Oscillospiraceae bacterium]
MEYVDIYTAQRELTGKTEERGKALGDGEYRLIIHAAIFNRAGQLLIQQRQPFKRGWPGLWDLTMGGAVSTGETSAEALVRELQEELGLAWDLQGEPPALSLTFDHGFDDIYLLRGEVELSTLQLQYEEVAQVKWATQEEVHQMLDDGTFIPYHKSLIDLLFDMREKTDGLRTV